MAVTTTVRVRTETRDRLNRLAASRNETVDQLIDRGLSLVERDTWRRVAEADARRVATDAEDRAEVRAAIRELTGE
jgi:predicted transcriptional regulator